MKRQDLQQYRTKTSAQITEEVQHLRERLSALRFDLAAGKVKNLREIHTIKRSIAQLLTLEGSLGGAASKRTP